ncbi:MAG: helix-turn-helix domain-containing protein [Nitrospirota bacterium]
MTERNYYRLLEVPATASQNEIVRAYELAKRTYGGESLATYSLFDTGERQAVMAKIEEAYRTLSDPDRRREYDAWLAAGVGAVAVGDSAPAGGAHKPSSPAPSAPEELEIPELLHGRDLQRLRERLGISLQAIANQTRISVKYLQQLEEDQHDKLPHPVFVRGYLLQYAQALKLDADQILNGYLRGMAKGSGDS